MKGVILKSIFCLTLFIVVLFVLSFTGFSEDGLVEHKIIVYYFHGSFRCITCTNMEKYSKEAIETNFKNELASGKLEFKTVNTEEAGNEHFVNDYQLYTKSLILSFMKDGEKIKSKNLDKIWQYVRNKQKFIEYVTNELNRFLEDGE